MNLHKAVMADIWGVYDPVYHLSVCIQDIKDQGLSRVA